MLNGIHHFSPARAFSARTWQWLLILGILLLAACLRLYQLDRIPPGFHYDEAFNAIQARNVLRGLDRPIFFTANFGEEPMQMYLAAALFALVGESPWSTRLSNVVFGLLLIPALVLAGRAFFPGRRAIPLTAAFISATLYWAVNFSRLGIETNSLPWILTLAAAALVLANDRYDWRKSVLAGSLLGASVYTYLASRVFPIAVGAWFLYLLLLHRRQMQWRNWLLVGFSALLVVAPLALFFLANPLALTGRSGQVLTLDQLGVNLVRTAGMFFAAGDMDPRDNLPGRAALDPFLGVLFLVGLGVSLVRVRKPNYAFLLIWFGLMTLPSALTEFAPNMRRAIGALPAVALLCGIGADWLLEAAPRFLSCHSVRPAAARATLVVLVAVGLGWSAYSSAHAYFVHWAPTPGLYYSFDAGLLEIGQKLAARPAGEQLCLSPDYHEHPTVLWALDGRAFSAFDGRRAAVLPNSALPTTCAIITHEDQTLDLSQFFPGAQLLAALTDLEGKPYARILHIPAGANPVLHTQNPLDARVGDSIRLLGFDLNRAGDRVDLTLYWHADATLPRDYTVFAHLIGPRNPALDSPVWSQDDAQPGHGSYPTSRWQAGQTIIDRYSLRLPPEAPPATYHVEFGMYLLDTGERLPLSIAGQRVPDDRIVAGELKKQE